MGSARGPGEFRAAMRQLRRARLRSGAHRWELYCVGEDPHQFVELVTVDSWDALTLQHERTRTVGDRSAEQAVARLSASTPRRRHLLPHMSVTNNEMLLTTFDDR
nr:MFS transporter [Tessaracoccus coleopterorum]